MRLTLFILVWLFGNGTLRCQNDSVEIRKNTFYIELLGNGGFYSINYDRIIYAKKSFAFSTRVGLSFMPPPIEFNNLSTLPLELNFSYGKKHHSEIGLGWTGFLRSYDHSLFRLYDSYHYAMLRVGYKFQRKKGGLFFRAAFIPAWSLSKYIADNNYTYTIAIGIGWTIKKKKK